MMDTSILPAKLIPDPRVISDGVSMDKYVIGADWALSKTKADAARRMRSAALGLALSGDGGQYVSGLNKTFVSKHAGRGAFVNALALIGAVERNAVVFHELPDGMVWVAAVRNHVPLPDCDRITTTLNAHELLGDYFGYIPDATLIGSEADAQRSVETVIKNADAKKRLASVYKKAKSPYRWMLIAGAIALALAAVVFAVQSIRVAREAAERARVVAMSKLNESARIDAAIQQYNVDVRKVVERARTEIAHAVPVQDQAAQWIDLIATQPTVQRGFRLDTASCDLVSCKFTWRALDRSGLAGPDASGTIAQRDDTTVTTVIQLKEVAKQERLREERLNLVSRFHQLGTVPGVAFRVAPELAAIVVPTPARPDIPADMQKQLAAVQPVTVGHQAVVDVAAPLSLLKEVVAMVGNAVTLKSLETTPLTSAAGAATAPQIKLSGSYVRIP